MTDSNPIPHMIHDVPLHMCSIPVLQSELALPRPWILTREHSLRIEAIEREIERQKAVLSEPAPKLTAERLIEIADEAANDLRAYIPLYVAASRKIGEYIVRAKDEGMSDELLAGAAARFFGAVDKVTAELERELDKMGKEIGLT